MGKFSRRAWLLAPVALAVGCTGRWQDGWLFSPTGLSKPPAEIAGPSSPDGNDSNGRPVRLSDHRGKVVLLSFWMTNCPPCRAFFPHEKQLVSRHRNDPFVLIGVNGDPTPELLKRTETQAGLTWVSIWDGPGGPLCRQWNVELFPSFVLLDATGKVRWRHTGVPSEGELEHQISRLLDEQARTGRR